MYKQIFGSIRFKRLAENGARVQRLLWASTGTKNPSYSDIKYVEPLIGPDTVNTMPVETINAYRDHGNPAGRIEEDADKAYQTLDALQNFAIELDQVRDRLEAEGVEKFNKPYDNLVEVLDQKIAGIQTDLYAHKL